MGKRKFTTVNSTLTVEMPVQLVHYFKPKVAADVTLYGLDKLENLHILLIKRKIDPFKNCWALPGGHIEQSDISIDAAALRELAEETGICNVKLRQFQTFGSPNRDPRGYAVTIGYLGVMYELPKVKGYDDAKDAKWFRVNKLPPLAFDHGDIIDISRRCLYEWTNGRISLFV